MTDLMILLMMSVTTFRLTWLVVRDEFPPVRWVREKIIDLNLRTAKQVRVPDVDGQYYLENRGKWSWLADLVTCYWCVSVWVSGGITWFVDATIGLRLPLIWFGAVAGIAAILCVVIAAVVDRE